MCLYRILYIKIKKVYLIKTVCFQHLICKLLVCPLSIFKAFLPNSNTKPKVKTKKKF